MARLEFLLKGTISTRAEIGDNLKKLGDAVLIERGVPRWLIMLCPCGCGEELPVNLDPRSGPAWRIYINEKTGLSLYPSVFRDTGCKSHFVIWRSEIFLFGGGSGSWMAGRSFASQVLIDKVKKRLPEKGYISYEELATSLNEIPWDVLSACKELVKTGAARQKKGKKKGLFGR